MTQPGAMGASRLGFPVKVLGRPGLKSNDSRRWQSGPHLRVSLEHLSRIFDYLDERDIRMYRMSSDLAPYATHPDLPQFHGMIRECDADLRVIGRRARELGLRLSFHPSQYVVLNSPDPALVDKSVWDIATQAEMLDRMELGPDAVVVIHVGGVYGDRRQSAARWAKTWGRLPEHARRRLVLEHDDLRFSAADVLWIHDQTGVRLVFDYQHFWCFNPERLEMGEALRKILATWPAAVRPKIHFSTPRTEMREVRRLDRATGRKTTAYIAPVWTGHADFCNPFEFATFMRSAAGLGFDVMLESKAKDLALIRLRPDLLRYAPDVALRFGLSEEVLPRLEAEEGGALERERLLPEPGRLPPAAS
jgi:UV DNA damage endonuclease